MKSICKVIIVLILFLFSTGCAPTREASVNERKGIMLLKPEEYARNKPYKPSKKKQKTHKKAQKSLLKRSYKIK